MTAHGLDGNTGEHAALVAFVRSHGFDVEADDEDKELTFIARPGDERFGLRVIGEIRGGEKAILRIMVKVD